MRYFLKNLRMLPILKQILSIYFETCTIIAFTKKAIFESFQSRSFKTYNELTNVEHNKMPLKNQFTAKMRIIHTANFHKKLTQAKLREVTFLSISNVDLFCAVYIKYISVKEKNPTTVDKQHFTEYT